jgi:protein tyrosine/serine phosphatase
MALSAMLALASMAASVTQTKNPSDVVENFGKVNENYYRGSQPDAAGFMRLKKLGVKTVIDLRKDSVTEAPEWVRAAGMQYFNIPLKASRPATEEQTAYFLKLVNDPNNWPVYVHCKGGRHRTGALTAIYRITHDGWTADQAYKEMKEYDFEHGFFGGPTAQKNYVYSYYGRQHADAGK